MSTQRYARAKRKPLIVTFYLDPPTEEVTVKDFEQLAWERLQGELAAIHRPPLMRLGAFLYVSCRTHVCSC